MVVVVPGLAERDRGEPGQVARLIAGCERSPAEEVAERVDAEGDVVQEQHVTFSINSLCHFFGRRPFATGDQSRNLAWLAPIAFGEAWHNNHHAFPTSARHGLGHREIDPGAWLITALERCHLAWDVVRISPGRQQAKRGSAAT